METVIRISEDTLAKPCSLLYTYSNNGFDQFVP